jgi:hypothetical protein
MLEQGRVAAASAHRRALLIRAEAEAEARVVEAKSRQQAGEHMTQPFAQEMALANQSTCYVFEQSELFVC